MSGIGSAIGQLVKVSVNDIDNFRAKLEVVKALSDSGRILADLQHKLSLARRAHITPTINIFMKNIADTSPVELHLYGKNFKEKVEAAKAIEKVGKKLPKAKPTKPPSKPPSDRPRHQQQQRNPPLNFQRPQNAKTNAWKDGRSQQSQRESPTRDRYRRAR
ncbi:unnamed protein product [Allacma fusca]|uniref:Uncharacterized protein n=1 Tax=Allacma fusca TaxID=39272 RepID=A0A8J2PM36_9HEXA|nr:unnamed protein product [Allacma fusca]